MWGFYCIYYSSFWVMGYRVFWGVYVVFFGDGGDELRLSHSFLPPLSLPDYSFPFSFFLLIDGVSAYPCIPNNQKGGEKKEPVGGWAGSLCVGGWDAVV